MWSIFENSSLLQEEEQKTEKPYLTLLYYQIWFLPFPMQDVCISVIQAILKHFPAFNLRN